MSEFENINADMPQNGAEQNINGRYAQSMQGNMQNNQNYQFGGYSQPGMYGMPVPPQPPQDNRKNDGFARGLATVGLFLSCVSIGLGMSVMDRIGENRDKINSLSEKVAAVSENAYDSDYFSDWLKGHDGDITALQDDLKALQEKTDSIGAEVEAHCDIIRGQITGDYGMAQDAQSDYNTESAYGSDGMYQFQTYADNFMVLKDIGGFYFNDLGNNEFTLAYESGTETDPYILDDYTVFKMISITPEEGGVERFDTAYVSRDEVFDYVNSLYQAGTTDEMVMTFVPDSRVITSITVYTGR